MVAEYVVATHRSDDVGRFETRRIDGKQSNFAQSIGAWRLVRSDVMSFSSYSSYYYHYQKKCSRMFLLIHVPHHSCCFYSFIYFLLLLYACRGELLIRTDAISKSWRGGRIMSYRALVIGGNLRGCVGFGVGKAFETEDTVDISCRMARCNIFFVEQAAKPEDHKSSDKEEVAVEKDAQELC
jgi:hypothetical protein